MANDKKSKVQEQLRMMKLLFRRLRLIYEKCTENCQLQGMEYTHIESLIPLKEEWDMKSEEKKTSEAYRIAFEDSKEATEVKYYLSIEIFYFYHVFFYCSKLLPKIDISRKSLII